MERHGGDPEGDELLAELEHEFGPDLATVDDHRPERQGLDQYADLGLRGWLTYAARDEVLAHAVSFVVERLAAMGGDWADELREGHDGEGDDVMEFAAWLARMGRKQGVKIVLCEDDPVRQARTALQRRPLRQPVSVERVA